MKNDLIPVDTPGILSNLRSIRKIVYRELCRSPPWENRFYPSGEMESGLNDYSADIKPEEFVGGSFSYNWPPGSDTSVLLIVDLTTGEFSWIIKSPASVYYPGRHTGTFSVPPDYPFKPPIPFWSSPILSPYVEPRTGQLKPALGPWSVIWAPATGLHRILNSFAAFLHYGPLYENMPYDKDNPVIRYDDVRLNYMTSELWYRLATNFFCRAYTLFDGTEEETDELATKEMRSTSVQAIKGLIRHAPIPEKVSSSLCPIERAGMTVEEAFAPQKIRTRKQWAEEERLWANALCNYVGVKRDISQAS
jgi:ubiquitin-protein ligase